MIIPRIKSLRPSISNNENEVKANVNNSPQNTKETETISPSPEELPKEDGEVIEAPIVECKPKVVSICLLIIFFQFFFFFTFIFKIFTDK